MKKLSDEAMKKIKKHKELITNIHKEDGTQNGNQPLTSERDGTQSGDQHTQSGDTQSGKHLRTSERIAKENNISERTVS